MAETPEREAVAPSAAALDPHDFPPYTLNDDERSASQGRLSSVDPEFSSEGAAFEAAPKPDPEAEYDPEAEAEAAWAANREAGAAGAGDDEDEGGRDVSAEGDEEVAEVSEPSDEAEDEEVEETEAEDEGEDEGDEDDPNRLTIAELKDELDSKSVEYDPRALKAELVELVRANR
jgi:hypothetical protein